MEGDSLYSVKWYRNEQEFFRYVPNDRPKLQIFPQRGIRVEVSFASQTHQLLYINEFIPREISLTNMKFICLTFSLMLVEPIGKLKSLKKGYTNRRPI